MFSVYQGSHIPSVICDEIPNLEIQSCHRTLPPGSIVSNDKYEDKFIKKKKKPVLRMSADLSRCWETKPWIESDVKLKVFECGFPVLL